MADEQKLAQALEAKFPVLAGKINLVRPRRMFVEVPAESFRQVLAHLKKEQGFVYCCTITGTDDKDTLAALYHLSDEAGTLLNLRLRVPRDAPVIGTVTDLYPCCANYERELIDLLGFTVENLPPGNRYPMPDDFPRDQHPLRKDWQPAAK
jgi:Ni,Fe-hydrogenase III component G